MTCTVFANAQYKMKYGKIDKADMQMTTYEADPGASAVVLGETMKVIFTERGGKLMLTYTYHGRIKILNKKGMEEADIAIPYWSQKRAEKIMKIKAQTLNWENGSLVKRPVEKDDIFEEKKNKYISFKKFAFPAVKVGSVLEYYYQLESDYYISVDDYFFQRDIPVRWSDYKVQVLESLNYKYDVQGKEAFDYAKQSTITLNHAGGSVGTEYHWRMTEVPALKTEPYITSMTDYYSGIRMRLASFEPRYGFHRKFIGSWMDMNALYFREIAEKNYLKENYSDKVWDAAQSKISGLDEPEKKMEALYDFVKENIKWNEIEEIDPDHTADYCYKEKEGSNTEINMTLLSLLRKAGIDAFPLLVSTRDHQKPMNLIPYLYQFNQTLIVAVINEKAYYLDASYEDYPIDILHPNNLNVEGWMIINEQKGQWIGIQPSRNTEILLPTLTLSEDGRVEGQVQAVSKGYSALMNREYVNEEGKEKYLKNAYLENLPDAEIENHKFSGLDNEGEQLKESMDFASNDMAQVAGDMIYFNPFITTDFSENPFKTEKREIPVDMPFGLDRQAIIKVTIPEGYTVETLPETTKFVLPNKGASFMYASSQKDNVIQIVCKMRIDQTYFPIEEYAALREFVAAVIQKEAEQIVLKKN